MIVIHYSEEVHLELNAGKTPSGADRPGIFVYPEGNESEWDDRTRHELYVPEEALEFVQNFEPGEIQGTWGRWNENEIIEMFIGAENFDKIKQ